jgi:hypothetical protein
MFSEFSCVPKTAMHRVKHKVELTSLENAKVILVVLTEANMKLMIRRLNEFVSVEGPL